MKHSHPQQRTYTTADKGQRQQGVLWDSPLAFLCPALVPSVGEKGGQVEDNQAGAEHHVNRMFAGTASEQILTPAPPAEVAPET